MTSGQEMEQVYSYNPGAHTGHKTAVITLQMPLCTSMTTKKDINNEQIQEV